jgi:hypothetical protein
MLTAAVTLVADLCQSLGRFTGTRWSNLPSSSARRHVTTAAVVASGRAFQHARTVSVPVGPGGEHG